LGYSIGAGAKQILPIMGAGFVAGPSGALGVGTALAATETIGNRLNFIQDVVKDLPPDEQATAIAEYLEKTGRHYNYSCPYLGFVRPSRSCWQFAKKTTY
jgi:hypothetical protein